MKARAIRSPEELDQLHPEAMISNAEFAALMHCGLGTLWRMDKKPPAGWPPLICFGPRISRREWGKVRAFLQAGMGQHGRDQVISKSQGSGSE